MWLSFCFKALSTIKGIVVDLQAEPVSEQVGKFRVLGSVERFDAQQELVVAGSEDGPPECNGGRADRQLPSEQVHAFLAEIPK